MSSKLLKFLKGINCTIVAININEHSIWVSVTVQREGGERFIGKVEKGVNLYGALDRAIGEALTKAFPGWTSIWRKVEKTDPITGEVIEVAG